MTMWQVLLQYCVAAVVLMQAGVVTTESCPNDQCITVSFPPSLMVENHALNGSLLSTLKDVSDVDCITACVLDCRCLSVNIKSDRSECQLNMENVLTAPGYLVPRAGYIYQTLNLTTKNNMVSARFRINMFRI